MPGSPASSPEESATARRGARTERPPSLAPMQVELTGATIGRALDALREGFTLESLRTLFVTELSVTLDNVVATAGRPFQDICRDTVLWALETEGVGLGGLIGAAARANPSLGALAAEWAEAEFVLPPCPYPGMVPFTEQQSGAFFGRDAEIETALQALRLHPFLAVIGASGSGKSSLAFAGIVPAMRKATGFGKSKLELITIRPGSTPLAHLAGALGTEFTAPPPAGAPAEMFALYARPFADAARAHAPVVIVVDQAEEMFGPEASAEADAFARVLLTLVGLQRVWVVLTVRADFYSFLIESPLWAQIRDHRLEVGALRGDGLRAAIAEPAHIAGVTVDPALVERLLADAAGEPGALPFIQETMVLLWERAGRLRLTLEDYQAIVAGSEGMSGLQVAMARRADQTYNELWEAGKPLAQRTFVRLIQFGEGRPDTRRRQPVSRLVEPGEDRALFDRTLQRLADHRLLTLSARDPSGAGGNGAAPDRNVDISHEALLSGWPLLKDWVRNRRAAEIQRRRFEAKAEEWAGYGSGETGLLDAGELAEVGAWLHSADTTEVGASDLLHALVERSRAKLDAAARAEEEARQRELQQQRALADEQAARIAEQARANAALRRRALIAAAIGALALVAAVVALLQWGEASRQTNAAQTAQAEAVAEANVRATAEAVADAERATAVSAQATSEVRRQAEATARAETQSSLLREQFALAEAVDQRDQARTAESRRLANLAQEQEAVDPVASIHLALAALPSADNPRPYVPEAELALQRAVLRSRERGFVPVEFSSDDQIAVSAGRVAVARADRVDLYDADLQPAGSLPLAGAAGLRWGEDGRLLAWTPGEVSIWRGASRAATLPLDTGGAPVYCAEWQPQQEWIAVCTEQAVMAVRADAGTSTPITASLALSPLEISLGTTIDPRQYGVAWSADGQWLAGWGPRMYIWDSTSPDAPMRELPQRDAGPGAYIDFAAWSPQNRLATAYGAAEEVMLVDPSALVAGNAVVTATLPSRPNSVVWLPAPDGQDERALVLVDWEWPVLVGSDGSVADFPGKPDDLNYVPRFAAVAAAQDGAPALLVSSYDRVQVYRGLDDPPQTLDFTDVRAATWLDDPWIAVGHQGGLTVLDGANAPVTLAGGGVYGPVRALHWGDGRLYSLEAGAPEADGLRHGALRLWQVNDPIQLARRDAADWEEVALQPPGAQASPACAPLGEALFTSGGLPAFERLGWAGDAVLAASRVDGILVRWEPESGAVAALLSEDGGPFSDVLWSPDGKHALRLGQGPGDGTRRIPPNQLEFFALEQGRWQQTGTLELDAELVTWLDGGIVATNLRDTTWWVDPVSGAAQPLLEAGFNDAAQLPGGLVALATNDGWVRVIDPATLRATESYSLGVGANVLGVAATADGANLLFSVQYEGVEMWPRGAGEPAWAFAFGDSLSLELGLPVAYHPRGDAVALLDATDMLLLDGASGAVLQRTDTGGTVSAVKWSDDGTRLLAWVQELDDAYVQLLRWDRAQQRADPIQTVPQLDPGWVQRDALNAAGDQLLVLNPAGTALARWRVWPDYRDLVQEAQECFVTHELTEGQRREFVLD